MFATGGWNGDATVRLWNLASASLVATLGQGAFPGTVTSVAFSPDGQALVAASADYLYSWDMRGTRPEPGLRRNSHDTYAVTYDTTGKRLASTSGGTVLLWEA
jgi:WD40 repeat protein